MRRYLISGLLWLASASFAIILLPFSFILWFLVWPFDENRIIFHRWLAFQSIVITGLFPAGKFKVEGCDRIKKDQAYVIISNHQSALDILALYRLKTDFKWISKIENTRVPGIGWYLKMAGYITIERGNSESKAVMMKSSVEVLRKGISIMIFPEGTRSVGGEIGPFKKGAFELAMMTDKPILPVVLDGTWKMLPKHSKILYPVEYVIIRVLDPVFPGMFGTSSPEELAEKFRTLISGELKKIRSGIQ